MRKWLTKMACALIALALIGVGAAIVCGAAWLFAAPWPDSGWVIRTGAWLTVGAGVSGGANLVFGACRALVRSVRRREQPQNETTLWVVSDGVATRRLNGLDLRVEVDNDGYYCWGVAGGDAGLGVSSVDGWESDLTEAMDAAEWAVRRIEAKGGEA